MKHTPAPWHVGMKPGPIIYGRNGEQIVDMRETLLEKDEHRANMALIIAAPVMLKALQAIKARIDGEFDHPALLSYGFLSTSNDDILRIVESALQGIAIK